MKQEHMLASRIITPDGTMLQSFHRHDYKTYKDENGNTYMLDGGLDYKRTNYHAGAPYTDASVYTNDPHDEIRRAFFWGHKGKDGSQPVTFKPLYALTNSHIEAILETQTHISEFIRQVFANEIQYRLDNNLVMENTK